MLKSVTVTITDDNAPSPDGRDRGKVFLVTEMPAFQAEKWATRATLALLPRITRELPPEISGQIETARENAGMQTLNYAGMLLGQISFPETASLMDELFDACVQFVPDPSRPMPRKVGMGGSEDIQEVATIAYLRQEALALHSSFTLAAGIFNLISAVSTMSPLQTIPISPPPSEPQSVPTKPPFTSFRPSTH